MFAGQLGWTFEEIDRADPVRLFRLLYKLLDMFKQMGGAGGNL